jgi:sterol desaturase/sphingolipid hydroxylase (fatty acid hydroxylase superfamily)
MEGVIRLAVFVAIFAAVALAEWLTPARAPTQSRRERWRINLSMLVLDVLAQRATLGAAAFATALWAEAEGVGLLNAVDLPATVEVAVALVALDLAVWLQHLASHRVPLFWRLHAVHHADLDLDLTTGLRFHPLEILLSALWKAALVAALGADPWAVVLFEAMLNAAAVYTHGNWRLPPRMDAALRLVVCTPAMHGIHHSVIRAEADSNYGAVLSVWDRLFGTYRAEPTGGEAGLTLGLPEQRDPAALGLAALMLWPFRRRAAPGDCGRRASTGP